MKTYSLWVLCLFVLWKTCRNHGSSQCKNTGHHDVQFRSSVFSSISRKKHSLTHTFTTRRIQCAARCLEDDKCVGIKEEKNQGKCSTLGKKSDFGYVWIRNSGTSNAETCKGVSKKAYFLSAHVSSRKWAKKGKSIKGKLKWFDPKRRKVVYWKTELTILTDASQAVITSLLGSSQVVILLLDKPRTLCSAKVSGNFTCIQVPSDWDTIGGMQLHLGYLYVSAGKELFRLKIMMFPLFRKLSDPQLVMDLSDTPSEIAIDALNGKRMIFYSMESKGQIGRSLKYSHKQEVKHMNPLNISCNHFKFTIDPAGQVMYVLTNDRKLSLIRDIHAENPPPRSTVLKVSGFYWPKTRLLFAVNTVHVISNEENRVMFYDIQEERYHSRIFHNFLISSPPRVLTVIAR